VVLIPNALYFSWASGIIENDIFEWLRGLDVTLEPIHQVSTSETVQCLFREDSSVVSMHSGFAKWDRPRKTWLSWIPSFDEDLKCKAPNDILRHSDDYN
jgi:hypothetical protein